MPVQGEHLSDWIDQIVCNISAMSLQLTDSLGYSPFD